MAPAVEGEMSELSGLGLVKCNEIIYVFVFQIEEDHVCLCVCNCIPGIACLLNLVKGVL